MTHLASSQPSIYQIWFTFQIKPPECHNPKFQFPFTSRQSQEQENSSDLADPMIMAIMTSRRTKRANAQNFRKWRCRLLLIQLFETDFSNYSSFKWYCIWISRINYHRSFLRGKYILIITEKFRIKCI